MLEALCDRKKNDHTISNRKIMTAPRNALAKVDLLTGGSGRFSS